MFISCIEKYAYDGRYSTLLSQFLRTSGSIVRHMGTESVKVCNHTIERTTGTDGFLLSHFLIGNTIFTV